MRRKAAKRNTQGGVEGYEMKSKCSDNIYYRSKDLTDDRYDLMERLNVFYSKKKKLENDIKNEKEIDPSEEVDRIFEEVQECDPLNGLIHPNIKDDERNERKNCANFILKVSANMECHAPITIQVLTARITLKTEIATEKTVYIDTEMIVGSTAV